MKGILFFLTTTMFSMLWTGNLLALAIDEKLPARILRVSTTQKTVLINRGLEDGLVVKDHAKFFITAGVVARGVLVKASPTRSVWSLYRIINAEYMVPDKLINLKISTPINITHDPTKMISPEDRFRRLPPPSPQLNRHRPNPLPGGVPVENMPDITDQSELNTLRDDRVINDTTYYYDSKLDWELWGMIHINTLSSSITSSGSSTTTATSGGLSVIDFSIGIEKYFQNQNSWYSKISFSPFIHKATQETTSVTDTTVETDVLEYGLGINWRFTDSLYTINKFIWFLTFTYGVGASTDSVANGTAAAISDDGTLTFYSFGVGTKYFTTSGFGLRMSLDYYARRETFDISSVEFTKEVSGPRFLVGASYRW